MVKVTDTWVTDLHWCQRQTHTSKKIHAKHIDFKKFHYSVFPFCVFPQHALTFMGYDQDQLPKNKLNHKITLQSPPDRNLLLGWAPYLVTQKLQIPTMTWPLLQNSHVLIRENNLEVCVLGDWLGASHQHRVKKSQEVLPKTWSQNSGWHITIIPMFLRTVRLLSCSLPHWILKLHPLLSLCFPLYFIHQLENTSIIGETSLAFCFFISLPVRSLKCDLSVNIKHPLIFVSFREGKTPWYCILSNIFPARYPPFCHTLTFPKSVSRWQIMPVLIKAVSWEMDTHLTSADCGQQHREK